MIKLYTDYFKEKQIQYDIICLNRYDEQDAAFADSNVNIYSFKGTHVGDSKVKKLYNYIQYRKFAISIMEKHKYNYIIVWGERTAPVFSDYLIKHKPYCVNIRDISFPRIPFFYNRLKKAIDNSDFATWCAPRGIEELPKHNYVLVYNQNKALVDGARKASTLVKQGVPIRIGAVGYIRHQEAAKQIMKTFCNDPRFVVQFFGTGAEKLTSYAEELGMTNIEIVGSFKPEQTASFLDRIDIINSYIGCGAFDKTIAIGTPIRYGYSTMLYKPAIVSPNTYMSGKTSELNIALAIDDWNEFPDRLYNWYHSLDFMSFIEGCNRFNAEVDETIAGFYHVCDERIFPIFRGEE